MLERYVAKGVEGELRSVREAEPGVQEITANNAGLRIHSLLKGAEVLRADMSVLREKARESFTAAVVAMMAGRPTEPWTQEWAEAKWEQTEGDAEPRELTGKLADNKKWGDLLADVSDVTGEAVELEWPVCTTRGVPKGAALPNTRTLLKHLGVRIRQNVFAAGRTEVSWTGETFRELGENDLTRLRSAAHERGLHISREDVCNNVVTIGADVPNHPVREYLASLAWDGRPRLSTWLVDFCGAEDTPLNRVNRPGFAGGSNS